MDLAIRADGGPNIGFGHLIRSNVLAEETLSRGHQVTVATTTKNPAESVFSDAVDITELASRGDPEPLVDWLDATAPDAVFTDSYTIDTEYQCAIRDRTTLAVLQDDARHAVCADLFVNSNLYAPSLNYELLGRKPELCLGTDYILLRDHIRNYAVEQPPWRDHPERAIIMMGGSDIADLTPTVINAFDGLDIRVDAIVGPGCSERQEQEIREAATTTSATVLVSRDPDDLAERMFQADFAVSTASSTTYELLALGTPIVSVPVADNQEPIASALRDRDAATVLTQGSEKDAFQNSVLDYIRDTELRRKRLSHGREMVDRLGVERIADAIARVAA